jgi:N6-adenosine-specific RNA methylase IME4
MGRRQHTGNGRGIDGPTQASQGEAELQVSRELAALDTACQALAEANTLEEVKELRDVAEAVRKYLKSAAKALEVQRRAAELRLRAERKLGQLLNDAHLRGGDRRSNLHRVSLKLRDSGITHQQSRRCQLMASIPDADFEQYIRRCNESEKEMTSSALIRMAERIKEETQCRSAEERSRALGEIKARLEELIGKGTRFACVLVRPAWPQQKDRPCRTKSGRDDAVCAFTRRLARLPVGKIAADEAHLHLYAPSEWLGSAIMLLRSWGFTYRDVFLWHRKPESYGLYWRTASEFLVLGVRGRLPFRDNGIVDWAETDEESSTDLSEPIAELIERVSPGPYLELFGSRPRNRWTVLTAEKASVG